MSQSTKNRVRIGDGAEGIVYREGDKVIKERPKKAYRLDQIDEVLRRKRTREEAHILKRLGEADIAAPSLFASDDKEMTIEMEFLEGPQLRDVLSTSTEKRVIARLAVDLGDLVSRMHALDIMHGDLTTSNMVVEDGKIHLIDFGLGFFSTKVEDRAVDLHLLERSLTAQHPAIADQFFQAVLDSYCKALGKEDRETFLQRLEKVTSRGRYKNKS